MGSLVTYGSIGSTCTLVGFMIRRGASKGMPKPEARTDANCAPLLASKWQKGGGFVSLFKHTTQTRRQKPQTRSPSALTNGVTWWVGLRPPVARVVNQGLSPNYAEEGSPLL